MDRFTQVLAGLLGQSARLLPASLREWTEAVLAEAREVPAGAGRLAWPAGGLWLVAREVTMRGIVRALAFTAGAAALAWISWPGSPSNSATALNRTYLIGTVVLLAALPLVIRRYLGPARPGWAPRVMRAGGYALVLILIAAKAVKDRDGSKLGQYFVVVSGLWAMEILLLLVIAAYAAGPLVLTSRRLRLTRWSLPAAVGLGAITAGALYPLAPFGVGVDPASPSLKWFGVAALVLPAVTAFLVTRLSARDPRPGRLPAAQQGTLAATCAMAAAALLLAVLTSVSIALLPSHVPLQLPRPGGGLCETCDPVNVTIPLALRHEYWAEISVGQAGQTPLAFLLLAPLLGAGLGGVTGAVASRRPRTSGPEAGDHRPRGRLRPAR
ncbi:MAG: hypothetical protein ACRDPO_14450 [Streptosporangiaceae bacterium]